MSALRRRLDGRRLYGRTLYGRTLDGRQLSVRMDDVVSPGTVKVVTGEGMPISKTPRVRGDLVIRFDVKFPRVLTGAQKQALLAALRDARY